MKKWGIYDEQSSRIFKRKSGTVSVTAGRDGKAKCRPFMFAGEMEGEKYEYRSFKKRKK